MINSLNNRAPATGGEGSAQGPQGIRQAAQAFEAVFIRQLIGSMRSAHLADDMFGSQATEQFRDMADSRLADSMSQQGTFGIADMLTAQFRNRAGAQPASAAATATATPANGNGETAEVTR